MGVGSDTLTAIRKMFALNSYERAPFVPSVGYQGLSTQNPYFSYGVGGTVQGLADQLRIDMDLVSRYVDYEDQDDNPLICSAIDVYTEDATQVDNEQHRTVWIQCKDSDIKNELEDLLYRRLKVEEHVWRDMRTLVKYGNCYHELVAKDRYGLVAANFLSPPTMRRIEIPKEIGMPWQQRESEAEETMGFIYDPRGSFTVSTSDFVGQLNARMNGDFSGNHHTMSGGQVLENWEVSHMRLMSGKIQSVYGAGVGEAARWIFKRLLLLEDAILMHRLSRSPSKFAFYVDVTAIPPQETMGYLNRVKQSIKKQKFVNPATGKFDQRFNVSSSDEDFFLPVRDGKEGTRVETLNGPVYDHIEDVKFFEAKLFAALKVPRPFLTYEETTAKTHLSAEDARFARSVMRVQREYCNGLRKQCDVHLAAKGINPESVEYDVKMAVPSAIFELAQLEIRNAELELADKFGAYASRLWVMQNVLGFSEEEAVEMERQKKAEEEEGISPPESGSSGAIDKALSSRGDPNQNVPQSAPPATGSVESRLLRGTNKNTETLLERIDEMRAHNKSFDKRWSDMQRGMREVQDAMRFRTRSK